MPRPLVFGNGRLLIAFDDRHQGRDLFWPNVGYPNHLLGHSMRVGIWCDSEFSWCDSDDWTREQSYEPGTLVGSSLWRSWKLGLEIHVTEAVHPQEPVFVRRLLIQDLRGANRTVKVFFTQNFILGQSDVGNTAFYHPFCDALIHYRGPYLVACTLSSEGTGIQQYATGIKGFGGLEGTWKDAEDGALSMNAIAQGSVDSTIGVTLNLLPQASSTTYFACVLGDRLDKTVHLLQKARETGWDDVFESARQEAATWLTQCHVDPLETLSSQVRQVFDQSLLVIRTQIDHEGAVVAANDADILETNRATYSYCWARDGALVSKVMASLGETGIADRFVSFCGRVMQEDQDFLMQKYRSDGSLGASWHPWVLDGKSMVPFQEDETALALVALESCSPDVRRELWDKIGKRWADALLFHRDSSGLPLPSWDLWEERHGVHFFTVCTVALGLLAAANLAEGFGEEPTEFQEAATLMARLLGERFCAPDSPEIARMVSLTPEGWTSDFTPDSAILGGLLLLGLEKGPTWQTRIQHLMDSLRISSDIGGFARYSGDYYFRKDDNYPGNPWVISTMWFSRYLLSVGNREGSLELLELVAGWASKSGILAEQYHPRTGSPLSVSPLTWSHAEFVETVLAFVSHSRQPAR